MSQENILKMLFIAVGVMSIICIMKGFTFFSKEESLNKTSKYYESIYFLIFGSFTFLSFLVYLFCKLNLVRFPSKVGGLLFGGALIVAAMFISGLYVFLNKEKIENSMLKGIANQGLVFSIIGIISLIYWWIKWHGFN